MQQVLNALVHEMAHAVLMTYSCCPTYDGNVATPMGERLDRHSPA